MSDFARERGGKPQNVAQSVGRRVSLPDRQSQQIWRPTDEKSKYGSHGILSKLLMHVI